MPGTDAVSSLPIRTVANGDVVAFLADGTTPSQLAAIDTHGSLSSMIKDAAGNAVTTQVNGSQQALDVGVNVAGVQIDPRQIRPLTSADIVTANQGTAAALAGHWPVQVTDGTNVMPTMDASGRAGFMHITDGTNSAAVKAASTPAAAGDPSLVVALSPNSPLPAGSNLIGNVNVYSGGNPNSNTNPLFVTVTTSVPGTPVKYYNATSNIAALATDSTSVYTITASKTLSVKKVHVSSSVRMRADFQISPDGSTYSTVFTTFTSTAGGFAPFDTDELAINDSGSGSTVRVVFTNEDNKAAAAYVTILGTEN